MMEEVGSSWTLKAKQLSQLLRGARSDETHIVELLEQLNEFSYPVQGVASQVLCRYERGRAQKIQFFVNLSLCSGCEQDMC